MNRSPPFPWSRLGIERVAVGEITAVAHVDVLTRSQTHAAELEAEFGVQPFRFARGYALLHAFPRLPAIAARRWLEARCLKFAVPSEALPLDGPLTWVQGGGMS